jgi:hypothetical protein
VILVGNGCSKQRHNTIAEHLVHGTLIAMHGVHHAVEGGVQELLGSFRIKAADELGRILEVGKEYCHPFALAFQGTTGRENFLRKIGWGVGEWWLPGCRRGRHRSTRSGARVTRPDKTSPGIIAYLRMCVQECVLEVV